MKPLHVAAGISATFVVSAAMGLALSAGLAMAQSDASSTTEATSTTQGVDTAASSTPTDLSTPISQAPVVTEAPLKLARAIGTKYVDYCTDGTKTIAVPGDPVIDANLNKPDAATPKCPDGMTWDHTSGMETFDTASGELDVGSYAKQADGSYIAKLPATTYTDATSTADWPERIVVMSADPAAKQSAPTSAEPTNEIIVDQATVASSTAPTAQ